ncbi:D-alanyl-D-alanine carboxypeptidase [Deinobacterium chartae]|uniref:D-alanyl-D-alanine carboxypeptidase n=1 Tax=Deinobacterium chartae TaxID=521158 RepID=A0A841I658_9DEIO|nr:serine hydrolase domain-containing protein [Deinobacterium chartae]MBB6099910.1 D-alanyl-D-alanine carboxypeptidase [Deinobacterium chartae]
MSDLTETLRFALLQRLRHLEAPGAAVSLLADGHPVFEGSLGHADWSGQIPLAAEALFPIYSVTKPLIAAATLQIAAQGRIDLEAPVADLLPDLPPALRDGRITVRRLLNHTAGLPDYGGLAAYRRDLRADPTSPWSDREFLEHSLRGGLRFAPGQGWGYSNVGYQLLRLLLEHLENAPLKRVLEARLFAPLGLRATRVAERLEDTRSLTPGFSALWSQQGELQNSVPRYHPGWVAHGVVVSSAPELARLTDALFSGKLLDRAWLEQMQAPVEVGLKHPIFRQAAYGLGLMLDATPGRSLAGHGGGGPGFSAGALHLRLPSGRRLTGVGLVNRDRDEGGLRLAADLLDHATRSSKETGPISSFRQT